MTYSERITNRSSRDTEQMIDDAVISTSQSASLVIFNSIVGVMLGALTIVYNITGRNVIEEFKQTKEPKATKAK